MTFEDASEFVMPFGMYAGATIHQIAQDHDGLDYLNWFRKASVYSRCDRVKQAIKAIHIYCHDRSVKLKFDRLSPSE